MSWPLKGNKQVAFSVWQPRHVGRQRYSGWLTRCLVCLLHCCCLVQIERVGNYDKHTHKVFGAAGLPSKAEKTDDKNTDNITARE